MTAARTSAPRTGDVLDAVREACAIVAARARHVAIDEARLAAMAAELAVAPPPPVVWDERHHHRGDAESTLAFVLTLDAINFGSGWFPTLRKRGALSGYLTLATALKDHFDARGPWSAQELMEIGAHDAAAVLGQDLVEPPVAELMGLYARAWNDLGAFLLARFGGECGALVEEARGSAAELVLLLAGMPFYRDVARYAELEVPFYKRAQITASDLAAAFGGRGPGRFDDLGRLTIFADNLVPHVLRHDGILRVAPELAEQIERGELLPSGSEPEVELRAVALHAVERMVAAIRALGGNASARALDHALWKRGQSAEIKARPRHRARTVYY
jgi:hypothetical protein